jgi:hypothetical protein
MTQQKPTQKQVNEICRMLTQEGEAITTKKVKQILGYGRYHQIYQMVETFNATSANKKQDHATSPIKLNDSYAGHNQSPKDNGFWLNETIRSILKAHSVQEPNNLTLVLNEAIHKQIQSQIESELSGYKAHNKRLIQENDHLKTQLHQQNQSYQKLYQTYSQLKEKLMISKNVTKEDIQNLHKNQGNARENDKPAQTSHQKQLQQLKGHRRAALNEAKNVLVLQITDFNPQIIRVLKAGKQGLLKARATYSYETYLWEVSDYTAQTIKFLFQNGFDLSDEIHDRLKMLVHNKQEITK